MHLLSSTLSYFRFSPVFLNFLPFAFLLPLISPSLHSFLVHFYFPYHLSLFPSLTSLILSPFSPLSYFSPRPLLLPSSSLSLPFSFTSLLPRDFPLIFVCHLTLSFHGLNILYYLLFHSPEWFPISSSLSSVIPLLPGSPFLRPSALTLPGRRSCRPSTLRSPRRASLLCVTPPHSLTSALPSNTLTHARVRLSEG